MFRSLMSRYSKPVPEFVPRVPSGIQDEALMQEIVEQLQDHYSLLLGAIVEGYITPLENQCLLRFVGYREVLSFNAIVYLCDRDDSVSGLTFQSWDAFIADIVIKRKSRGYGTRIVRAFLAGMECIGIRRVLITVTDSDAANGALRFWKRQGFEHIGEQNRIGSVLKLDIQHASEKVT